MGAQQEFLKETERVFATECAKDGLRTPGEVRTVFEKMAADQLPKDRQRRLSAAKERRYKNAVEDEAVLMDRDKRGIRGRVKHRTIYRMCSRCFGQIAVTVISDGSPTRIESHECRPA